MKGHITLLLVIFIIIFLFFFPKGYEKRLAALKRENFSEIVYPESQDILKCYQTLYDITKLFDKHKIEYYIDGGTLLGAVRHKGMIPWDDDLDVEVLQRDESKLTSDSFKLSLKKSGYNIHSYRLGYKIYKINGRSIENYEWKYPFLDVFISKIEDNRTKLVLSNKDNNWDKCHFLKDELYPLKKYKFGEFQVTGPNDPYGYLNKCYGKDWNSVKYQEWNHKDEKRIEKVKSVITESDRRPGTPMGPIKK
jgi:phosphorylcholine metabolism protein LicD